MIRAIIFDWHGVLSPIRPREVFIKWSRELNIPIETIRNIFGSLDQKFMMGTMPEKEFHNDLQKALSMSDEQIQYFIDYISRLDLNDHLWQMLPTLKNKYKLAILSDSPKIKSELIQKNIDLSIFDEIFFSSTHGLSKRTDEFFLKLTNKLGVTPTDCIFVDDNQGKVERAKQIGFKTCLFNSVEDLKKCIVEN